MDSLEQIKKLREEYERALDAAESRRYAYHEAVFDLYHSGTPLREIAKELGLSHQRIHQIVSGEPPHKRDLKKAAAGGAAALVLLALSLGTLRLVHLAPFTSATRTPLLSRDAVQQIDKVALLVARSNGDPGLGALAITQSKADGLIRVVISPGDYVVPRTHPSRDRDSRLTVALDPQTLSVLSVGKYPAHRSS